MNAAKRRKAVAARTAAAGVVAFAILALAGAQSARGEVLDYRDILPVPPPLPGARVNARIDAHVEIQGPALPVPPPPPVVRGTAGARVAVEAALAPLPPPLPIVLPPLPELIFSATLGFEYLGGLDYDVFYINGYFYTCHEGHWYATYRPGAAWVAVTETFVPVTLRTGPPPGAWRVAPAGRTRVVRTFCDDLPAGVVRAGGSAAVVVEGPMLPPPPMILLPPAPQVAFSASLGFEYVAGIDFDVFCANNYFYTFHEGRWFATHRPNEAWMVVTESFVPVALRGGPPKGNWKLARAEKVRVVSAFRESLPAGVVAMAPGQAKKLGIPAVPPGQANKAGVPRVTTSRSSRPAATSARRAKAKISTASKGKAPVRSSASRAKTAASSGRSKAASGGGQSKKK